LLENVTTMAEGKLTKKEIPGNIPRGYLRNLHLLLHDHDVLLTTYMAFNNSDTAHNSLAADLGGTDISNLYGVIDRDK